MSSTAKNKNKINKDKNSNNLIWLQKTMERGYLI